MQEAGSGASGCPAPKVVLRSSSSGQTACMTSRAMSRRSRHCSTSRIRRLSFALCRSGNRSARSRRCSQQRSGDTGCSTALLPGADRPAGRQGRRRHLRGLPAGARDRGACKGDPAQAAAVRAALAAEIGTDLSAVTPGSEEAKALRTALMARGLWSQYLEVGIGEDAEIFTKAQPLSAVGYGATVGIHPKSHWNNPEPEIVLAVSTCRPHRRRDPRQRREPARL